MSDFQDQRINCQKYNSDYIMESDPIYLTPFIYAIADMCRSWANGTGPPKGYSALPRNLITLSRNPATMTEIIAT
jgi:hypothetical protein